MKIVVDGAVHVFDDQIDGTGRGDRCDRQSRGERLEDDVAEGLRARREDEAVGAGEVGRQLAAELVAAPQNVRVVALELLTRGSVAHHHLGPRQRQLQEVLQALLDGHPPDVEPG